MTTDTAPPSPYDMLLALSDACWRVIEAGVPLERTPEEAERKRRIDIAAWAYAYEINADPLVDDATYDREALLIQPQMSTGHPVLDRFFRQHYSPHTGLWIHRHPEIERVRVVVERRRRYRTTDTAPAA